MSSPRGVCAVTGDPLSPGDPCVSLLVDIPGEEGFDRLDVARPAWDQGRRPETRGQVVGIWRTVVPEKDGPRKQLVGDEEVLDLFEQLDEADDSRQLAFRYLLCLILIRKRQLVWDGAIPARSGEPAVVLVRRRGDKEGELMRVIDPALDDEAIEAATEQLSMVMNLDPES